jgi:hypothetical protein
MAPQCCTRQPRLTRTFPASSTQVTRKEMMRSGSHRRCITLYATNVRLCASSGSTSCRTSSTACRNSGCAGFACVEPFFEAVAVEAGGFHVRHLFVPGPFPAPGGAPGVVCARMVRERRVAGSACAVFLVRKSQYDRALSQAPSLTGPSRPGYTTVRQEDRGNGIGGLRKDQAAVRQHTGGGGRRPVPRDVRAGAVAGHGRRFL